VTPAEFRCAREYLGLEIRWIAKGLDVSVRQVNRWESGISPIPDRATRAMTQMLAYTDRCVGFLTVEWPKQSPPRPLVTYDDTVESMGEEGFPASWHRALCSRVAERTGLGIVYADRPPAARRPRLQPPLPQPVAKFTAVIGEDSLHPVGRL
jgi:hypothetical protein